MAGQDLKHRPLHSRQASHYASLLETYALPPPKLRHLRINLPLQWKLMLHTLLQGLSMTSLMGS